MSDAAALLDQLESRPLVGRHRPEIRRGLAQVAAAVAASRDRHVLARLLSLGARLARAEGARDAMQRLNIARRAAAEAGDLVLEDRLALITVRTLAKARAHHRAEDLLLDVQTRAGRTPALAAELALARAAVGLGEPRVHLEDALATLPSPAADHDRMEAALDLAELLLAGAASEGARAWFEHARALARSHDAPVELGIASGSLALLALESGEEDRAAGLLDEALAAADAIDDDLGRVAHGTVRAALHLAAGQLAPAARLARRTEKAARRRSNWIGVADAVITQTLDEPLELAVRHLLTSARSLQDEGAQAAANLLKARLGELRAAHSEARFEAALAEAAQHV
jgi:hypothetical protein